MRFFLVLMLAAVLVGCAQNVRTPTAYREPPNKPARRSDPVGTVGTQLSPVQFLEHLKQCTNTYIGVFDENRDWILAEDIGPLMSRLDSQIHCAGVVAISSSHLPYGSPGSTEGHEAALLV